MVLLPFADVPASSSDSPLPPETGQQCGPGGGETAAADRDRLSQVVFFLCWDEITLSTISSGGCPENHLHLFLQ